MDDMLKHIEMFILVFYVLSCFFILMKSGL